MKQAFNTKNLILLFALFFASEIWAKPLPQLEIGIPSEGDRASRQDQLSELLDSTLMNDSRISNEESLKSAAQSVASVCALKKSSHYTDDRRISPVSPSAEGLVIKALEFMHSQRYFLMSCSMETLYGLLPSPWSPAILNHLSAIATNHQRHQDDRILALRMLAWGTYLGRISPGTLPKTLSEEDSLLYETNPGLTQVIFHQYSLTKDLNASQVIYEGHWSLMQKALVNLNAGRIVETETPAPQTCERSLTTTPRNPLRHMTNVII